MNKEARNSMGFVRHLGSVAALVAMIYSTPAMANDNKPDRKADIYNSLTTSTKPPCDRNVYGSLGSDSSEPIDDKDCPKEEASGVRLDPAGAHVTGGQSTAHSVRGVVLTQQPQSSGTAKKGPKKSAKAANVNRPASVRNYTNHGHVTAAPSARYQIGGVCINGRCAGGRR